MNEKSKERDLVENVNNGNGGDAMKTKSGVVLFVVAAIFAVGCFDEGSADNKWDATEQAVCQSDDDCANGKCMENGKCEAECLSDFNCYALYGAGGLKCENGRCESTTGEQANWVPNGGGSSGGNSGSGGNGDGGETPDNGGLPKPECVVGESLFCGLAESMNKGECHPGAKVCGPDGKWGECLGAQLPQPEVCDGKDNDCDGNIDETFKLSKDADNCGKCGNKCGAANAVASCVDGACSFECMPSFIDMDGQMSDGCEFQCLPTWGGKEKCDGLDNDCDSKVDEDFNLLTDVNNCGICGNVCVFAHAKAKCFFGNCVAEKCDAGYVDANEDAIDGCECKFAGAEVCDGFKDENCDGAVDEWCPCIAGANCGSQIGECQMGSAVCLSGGSKLCVGEVKPALEICDYLDNDCDGLKDEDFDLSSDVDNCGYCGLKCGEPNAVMACVQGACEIDDCNNGWYDLEDSAPGCEYPCWFAGEEKCNGVDDDCNGDVDEMFDTLTDVNNCGQCGNVCALYKAQATCVAGKCAVATCEAGFVDNDENPLNGCEYKCTVSGAEVCDGAVDEDCDGSVDEDCSCKNGETKSGGTDEGLCQKCVQTCVDGKFSECLGGKTSVPELCDVQDNDCDGSVDEDFNTQTDTENCGWCGHKCSFINAKALCVAGLCQMSGCTGFFHDVNNDPADGCEYACVPAGGEKCNGVDDDCDGKADEDFDFFDDLANCGGCGNVCKLWKVQENVCFFGMCLVGACEVGYVDLDKNPLNGCEYKCTVAGAEVCDGSVDEDCDGSVDEDCSCKNGETKSGGTDEGSCVICTQTCVAGKFSECMGGKTSVPELCDVQDNDCDGSVDEDFNTQTDPVNCGWCGHVCVFSNAVSMCVDGLCQMGGCKGFFHDVNNDPADGCEYACVPAGGEKCNGVDDDCDGLIDETFNVLGDPLNCGQCGNACSLDGAIVGCSGGKCVVASCLPDRFDLDKLAANGCEYKCVAVGMEVCDPAMADEDCDGSFNEDCKCADGSLKLSGSDEGECEPCIQLCLGGEWTACAGEVASVPELCDGKDNDCDGSVDEDFNTQTDSLNCGWCGNKCVFAEASAHCHSGKCEMGGCDKWFYDVNNDPADGCEYLCLNVGAEKCNGVDEDCDGLVDEGFDLLTDASNCGQCGNVCSLDGAVAGCSNGKCAVASCLPDRFDLDKLSVNGCEYKCVAAGVEVCDPAMADEDCDGSVNEGCDCKNGETKEGGTDEGLCQKCTQTCVAGKWSECLGGKSPVPELCDGKDNDCDEDIDEDFGLVTDPLNCGKCGNVCSFANGSAACANGGCVLAGCNLYYYDHDGKSGNGCEYGPCVVQGVEVCDGFDDDCDGFVDEGFDFATDVFNCGKCGNVCSLAHAATTSCIAGKCVVAKCESGFFNLDGNSANGCEYDCPFKIPAAKETCGDGLDNDCDGAVDEGCPVQTIACDFVFPVDFVPIVWWGGVPGYSWTGAANTATWSGTVPQICERGENPTIPAESGWIDFNGKKGAVYQWTPDVVASCHYVGDPKPLIYTVRVGAIDPGGEGEIVFTGVCL